MKFDRPYISQNLKMFRFGVGKNEDRYFVRLDFWTWAFRLSW